MELRKEHAGLTKEQEQLNKLVASEAAQWKAIGKEIRETRKTYGPDTEIGRRRTDFAVPPDVHESAFTEALVEREPITIVMSAKGWIRALKGHVADVTACPSRATTRSPTPSMRRPPPRSWCSPPTDASSRWMRPSSPAGAAMASPCA